MIQNTPLIEVTRLNHYFGKGENRQQVLAEITLEIPQGQVVMMSGPSGAGKTTLLTIMGALRTIQDGSVRVLGREYRNLSRRKLKQIRKEIGFIFQAHNLFSSLSAFRNVRLGMELLHSDARLMQERAEEILTQVGLADRMHYKPEHLSGGQRQRVAVARALANRPKLILADEPTAALDEVSATKVINLLKQLTRVEGSSVVVVTHDDRLMSHADRLIRMVDGRIESDELQPAME